MTFANLDRVKLLLELTVPKLKDRTDYDTRIRRLMGVVHEKFRQKIVLESGGTMPLYLILAAAAAPSATTVVAALTSPSRRLRFRLVGADAGDLLTTPMTATISATFDGVASTEVVEFNRNGEFVSKNAFEILASPVVFADISGTPGTVEILEDIEPVLADAEDMVTACLFLREVADQFEKDAEPEDTDFWCRKGMKLLDTWIKANLKSDILDHPLGLRAGS